MEPDPDPLDAKKMASAIAKIKKDRNLVPQASDMLKRNPEMARNAADLVAELQGGSKTMGMEVPLKERKKMLAKQELIRSQIKNRTKEGEVRCLSMLVKGKLAPDSIDLTETEKEERWCVDPVSIGDLDFLYVCDATAKITNKNLNKRATSILGKPIYGIVRFVELDEDIEPVDYTFKDFP